MLIPTVANIILNFTATLDPAQVRTWPLPPPAPRAVGVNVQHRYVDPELRAAPLWTRSSALRRLQVHQQRPLCCSRSFVVSHNFIM